MYNDVSNNSRGTDDRTDGQWTDDDEMDDDEIDYGADGQRTTTTATGRTLRHGHDGNTDGRYVYIYIYMLCFLWSHIF